MNEAPDGKILRIYRDEIIIEEIFKKVKNVIHLRPIYLRTPEHITAHIEIGVIFIIILNTLKLLVETRTATKISAKKIQSALTDLKAIPLSHHTYRITGNAKIIKTLSETFGLDVFKSSMLEKDLKNLFYKI